MSPTSSTNGFLASQSNRRRPPRVHEWTQGKVVTFVVTLAATRSVTLAARAAGMSRKSAYALKRRDPRFADAWSKALNARSTHLEGDKADKTDTPPSPPPLPLMGRGRGGVIVDVERGSEVTPTQTLPHRGGGPRLRLLREPLTLAPQPRGT